VVNFLRTVNYKGRSVWKGLNLFVFSNMYFNENIELMKKSYVISTFEINNTYKIYNGKNFKTILFNYRSVGCKFGQFILTKKIGKSIHLKEKKKVLKKR